MTAMRVPYVLFSALIALSAGMVRADALDELVPRPKRVVRMAESVPSEKLSKVTVKLADVAGAPKHVAVESYRLEIGGSIIVTSSSSAGRFYALQTLAFSFGRPQ